MSLNSLRKKIDLIDKELVKLLDQRAEFVFKVGQWKTKKHKPILDSGREQKVLNQVSSYPLKNLNSENVRFLFKKLIEAFRNFEAIKENQNSIHIKKPQKGKEMNVGFLGFGLISASIALRLKAQFSDWNFIIYDPFIDKRNLLKWARKNEFKNFKLIQETKNLTNAKNQSKNQTEKGKEKKPKTKSSQKVFDLFFLGAPLDINKKFIINKEQEEILQTSRLILDLSSVLSKPSSKAKKHNSQAIFGFHPLAGKETSGFEEANPFLFEEKIIAITGLSKKDKLIKKTLLQLCKYLGAQAWEGSAKEHNLVLAYTSHLPQLIALVMGQTLSQGNIRKNKKLFPRYIRDVLRVCGSNKKIWLPILNENQSNILDALIAFQGNLEKLIEDHQGALNKKRNNKEIKKIFKKGNNLYNQILK